MRLLTLTAATLFAAAVAGCGGANDAGPAAEANQADSAVATPAATQSALEALPEGQRNGVFIRAVQDAGLDCQHVESSARAGEHQGLPLWTAHCTGGVDYTIVIGNDGSAAVLNPAEAAQLEGNAAAAGNVAAAGNEAQ